MKKENRKRGKQLQLSFFSVALMYVGTIMGAGFASGREIWQFFGVFGNWGIVGVCLIALLFMVMGMMTSYIARKLNTNDMGRVIVPGGNQRLINLVGDFMALMLFTVLLTMTAAGGALFYQQFGLSRILGGVLIAVMVIATVLGEFERVSRVFRYIMPVLFGAVVVVSVLVIVMDLGESTVQQEVEPSPMASNWFLAAFLYISYNILSMIPIVATASVTAKNDKAAIGGTGLGGFFLGLLAFLLLVALQKDMPYSQALDMPMLGYSSRISPVINTIYGLMLFFAIYSSATSNFYGFTTKIKEGPAKKKWVVVSAVIAFLLGLVGFKNVVAFMFPLEGFLGFVIIAMIIINFFKVWRQDKTKMKEAEVFRDFENHDRTDYPKPVYRVTGGLGGEALLILGSEKAVLYDAGMACFAGQMIANLEAILDREGRTLDYVILSHTHYDHIGGLPYVLNRWPEVRVFASAKAKKVFESAGARETMRQLGENAANLYQVDNIDIIVDPLRVDQVAADGDRISIGTVDGSEEVLIAYETKGHTDCSLTWLLMPEKILFACESTGVLVGPDGIDTAALKDFDETIASAEKVKTLPCDHLIIPHYGVAPEGFQNQYFDLYIQAAKEEKAFIEGLVREGKCFDEILEAHKAAYWIEGRDEAQPYAAYRINTEHIVKQVMKKVESGDKPETRSLQ